MVPTWNYTVVHAHGVLRPMQGGETLRAHLDALSAAQEAGRSPPWSPADAPADFIAKMMKGIVGSTSKSTGLKASSNSGRTAAPKTAPAPFAV